MSIGCIVRLSSGLGRVIAVRKHSVCVSPGVMGEDHRWRPYAAQVWIDRRKTIKRLWRPNEQPNTAGS